MNEFTFSLEAESCALEENHGDTISRN